MCLGLSLRLPELTLLVNSYLIAAFSPVLSSDFLSLPRILSLFHLLRLIFCALLRSLSALTPFNFFWYNPAQTDVNNSGPFSTDYIGMSYRYPTANWTERDAIISAHELYTRSLLYFLGNDPRLPAAMHSTTAQWGWCRDEFVATGHFPFQVSLIGLILSVVRSRPPFVFVRSLLLRLHLIF